MRAYILTSALLLASCNTDPEPRPPPSTRLVYPSGIAFWRPEAGPSTNGFLYVASANFDKCYDSGSVVALDLDAVGLRPFGTPFPEGPATAAENLTQLGITQQGYVQIDSFAGEMALWSPPGRAPRLFVPTRAESSYLQVIDVADDGTRLSCAQADADRDCRRNALSLLDVPGATDGRPAAPSPIGVSVERTNPDARIWVSHTELVGPAASRTEEEFQSYLVTLPAADPSRDALGVGSFVPLGGTGRLAGAAHATAIGSRYVYASGRNSSSTQLGAQPTRFILRLVDRQNPARVLNVDLELSYSVREGRGVAVTTTATRQVPDPAFPGDPTRTLAAIDERVFLLARGPDTLLVLDVVNAGGPGAGNTPTVRLVSALPLPEGSSEVEVIPRAAGRGNLVAVTGSGDEAVALFDEELGQLVAQVEVGVGDPNQPSQPFGLTADVRGNSARLFASTFGDGRIAVIDIPDLDRPQNARLVARLGAAQQRDPRQGTSVCQETSP